MKLTILSILTAAISPAAFSADYMAFRVCEDQHVLRTSDGAEAGHVEYIVLEPSTRQIVSTVVTGGVIGTRFVAIPFESLQFSGDREVILTQINRELLVSAPVIERTQITANVIQPEIITRTSNHFNVSTTTTATESKTATGAQERDRQREYVQPPRPESMPPEKQGTAKAKAEGTSKTERPEPVAEKTRGEQKERKGKTARPETTERSESTRKSKTPERRTEPALPEKEKADASGQKSDLKPSERSAQPQERAKDVQPQKSESSEKPQTERPREERRKGSAEEPQ